MFFLAWVKDLQGLFHSPSHFVLLKLLVRVLFVEKLLMCDVAFLCGFLLCLLCVLGDLSLGDFLLREVVFLLAWVGWWLLIFSISCSSFSASYLSSLFLASSFSRFSSFSRWVEAILPARWVCSQSLDPSISSSRLTPTSSALVLASAVSPCLAFIEPWCKERCYF